MEYRPDFVMGRTPRFFDFANEYRRFLYQTFPELPFDKWPPAITVCRREKSL
jgi:hypothetical protein